MVRTLYDREHRILQVNAALTAAQRTGFQDRFNCLLYGPPACGKTAILQGFKAMLGKEAYLEFDATSTTSAGAVKVLMEAESIPPVLVVEEIEKTDESSLRWLLGVSDQRSEVRKTNFRSGNISREVKLLVLATANDIGQFRRLLDGALPSRFPNRIHCPRRTGGCWSGSWSGSWPPCPGTPAPTGAGSVRRWTTASTSRAPTTRAG